MREAQFLYCWAKVLGQTFFLLPTVQNSTILNCWRRFLLGPTLLSQHKRFIGVLPHATSFFCCPSDVSRNNNYITGPPVLVRNAIISEAPRSATGLSALAHGQSFSVLQLNKTIYCRGPPVGPQ